MEEDEFYEDYELADEFSLKINDLIVEEVKNQIKQTVEELESINHEYAAQSIELSVLRNEVRVTKSTHEKQLKEAAKIAQREYWFDCAVGDKVFFLHETFLTQKCDRCKSSHKVKVIVDSVEVEAECPICGTYSKRQKMQYSVYEIVEGKVERLQIEINSVHKWIHVWMHDQEYKYEVGCSKIFRTREECQVAYDEAIGKKASVN